MNSNSAIPVADQRPSPPVPALGGIFTLDTVPSQAFAGLASMRCG
jgi:hypothetical protein